MERDRWKVDCGTLHNTTIVARKPLSAAPLLPATAGSRWHGSRLRTQTHRHLSDWVAVVDWGPFYNFLIKGTNVPTSSAARHYVLFGVLS